MYKILFTFASKTAHGDFQFETRIKSENKNDPALEKAGRGGRRSGKKNELGFLRVNADEVSMGLR